MKYHRLLALVRVAALNGLRPTCIGRLCRGKRKPAGFHTFTGRQ